jgi:ribosomal protein L11 methylase PrmA
VLPHFLTPETKLICSGILDCRLQDVVDALERVGIQITAIHAKEDWRCVEARRSHA